MRFALSFNVFMRVLCGLLRMGPAQSGVWIDDHTVRVRMGWAFSATFSLDDVASADHLEHLAWWWGQGVHGFRGRCIVNGSNQGLVRLHLDPGARTGSWPRIPVHDLTLSLEDPDGFLAALGPQRNSA